MSEKWPRFKISVVKDGDSKGLLIEKQSSEHAFLETVYFYLRGGLMPTGGIRDYCDDNCFKLDAEDYDERRLFNELVAYTVAAANTGEMRAKRKVVEKHHVEKGYRHTVDCYFEAEKSESHFREIFESASIFKKCVLKYVWGKHDMVQGKAEHFSVLPPEGIGRYNFKYLQPIQDVLEIGSEMPAKWFRKSGPIAADFDDERVYCRRELLDDLKKLVLQNSFSMLEGIAATGKTVLVRQLGYELHQTNKKAVYYFDCDLERNFDQNELVKEINSTKGICILENMHLETERFRRVHDRIKKDLHRHVLFVTRPSFRNYIYSRDSGLTTVEKMTLKPFNEVDEIIDHFASRHTEIELSAKVRESIKESCKESFWLISYALRGWKKSRGKGDPSTWISTGVKDDLRDLENINTSFPKAVVAISPLYQGEVLTEERFLTENLEFDTEVLKALVQQGEITEQDKEDGHVFYGLPHSGLADVYWKYGKRYRRRMHLPGYEDFIYEYAKSDVPNGLTAILDTGPGNLYCCNTHVNNLCRRLQEEGKMKEVLEHEESIQTISFWLEHDHTHIPLSSQCIHILANKLSKSTDIWNSIFCIESIVCQDLEVQEEFWASFDFESFSSRLVNSGNIDYLMHCMNTFACNKFQKYSQVLCSKINVKKLARVILTTEDTLSGFRLVSDIHRFNKKVGLDLLKHLNRKELFYKLRLLSKRDMRRVLGHLSICCIRETGILWNVKEIASKISRSSNRLELVICMSILLVEKPSTAKEVSKVLNWEFMSTLPRGAGEHRLADWAVKLALLIDRRIGTSLRNVLKEENSGS